MGRMNCIAIGILLFVFTVAKKNEIRNKKAGAISCGPAQSTNEHNSWPKDSGNGCSHQSVNAAFLGRNKRDKTHGC